MIFVAGRGDQPDPQAAVFRGVESRPERVAWILARFAALIGLFFLLVGNLPGAAALLLDPLTWAGDPGGASRAAKAAAALPFVVLVLAAAGAAGQQAFAFAYRRVALRKQSWALYHEFMKDIEAALEPGETPLAYRCADPPELAGSLMLRIVAWASLTGLALVATVGALALRVHGPVEGQALWYRLTAGLTLGGLAVLAVARTPPLLRLLIQGAIPALHFGHALMLAEAPLGPWGLPALAVDLVLGIGAGLVGYRLGQRERGGALYVFTDRGVLAFDSAGRRTRLLAAVRPLAVLALRPVPAGVAADFRGPDGLGLVGVHFESAEPVRELAAAYAARRLPVTLEEAPPRPAAWLALAEPGPGGWLVMLFLTGLWASAGHELLVLQGRLGRVLAELGSWYEGDPRPLAARCREVLAEDPGFCPARTLAALAALDAGELDAARAGLAGLPPDPALFGFAARVVPRQRRLLARLDAAGDDPMARAAVLLAEAPSPHRARAARQLAEGRSGPDADFLVGVAGLTLAEAPRAAYPWPGEDRAALLALVRSRVGRLEGTPRRFLAAALALAEGDPAGALAAAAGDGGIAVRCGVHGLRLAETLVLRAVDAAGDPAGRARGRALLESILGELGARPADPAATAWAAVLAWARPAFLEGAEADAALDLLVRGAPDAAHLFRLLAEESVGRRAAAAFTAFRLVGAEAARDEDPTRIPALSMLAPGAGYYVLALALDHMGRADAAAERAGRGLAEGRFPWRRFAAARGWVRP